jgi:hypothetical protein
MEMRLKNSSYVLAAQICDLIWMERNQIRLDGGEVNPILISSKVRRSFKEHKLA